MKIKKTKGKSLSFALKLMLTPVILQGLSACSDSSSDSGNGYVQLYNALPAAPSLRLVVEDDSYGSYNYNDASNQYLVESDTYVFEIDYPISNSKEQLVSEFEHKVRGDQVSLFVVTGDESNSEILKFDYEFEDPETDDEEFTFRTLNLSTTLPDIDIYIGDAESELSEATLLSTAGRFDFSDSYYFANETYKFFVTEAGTETVLFESEDIDFFYTNQQVIAVNDNFGAGQSPIHLSIISNSGSVTELLHKNSNSEVRFYNALTQHELFTPYDGSMNVFINQVDEEAEVANMQQSEYSQFFTIEFGDYPLYLMNDNQENLTNTQLVSTQPNESITKFFYLTEVEVDDNDDSTENEIEVHFNSIELQASSETSAFEHNFQVLNFSNEYPTVKVYFVGSDETKSTTDNVLTSNYSYKAETDLFNDSYDIYLVAIDGSSEILLASTSVELDETAGNYYLVLEETNGLFEANLLPQK